MVLCLFSMEKPLGSKALVHWEAQCLCLKQLLL